MNSPQFNGEDMRDLDPLDEPDCDICGAGPHEACASDCICPHCMNKHAREAALRALDIEPETAA